MATAAALSNAGTLSCSFSSSCTNSGASTSTRVLNCCPTLMKVGPAAAPRAPLQPPRCIASYQLFIISFTTVHNHKVDVCSFSRSSTDSGASMFARVLDRRPVLVKGRACRRARRHVRCRWGHGVHTCSGGSCTPADKKSPICKRPIPVPVCSASKHKCRYTRTAMREYPWSGRISECAGFARTSTTGSTAGAQDRSLSGT